MESLGNGIGLQSEAALRWKGDAFERVEQHFALGNHFSTVGQNNQKRAARLELSIELNTCAMMSWTLRCHCYGYTL